VSSNAARGLGAPALALLLELLAACGGDRGVASRTTTRSPPPLELGAGARLSETGLYTDMALMSLAPDVVEFAPAYELFSDGAEKRRWLRLPEAKKIDASDPDHWEFPVGALLFKEFAKGGRRIETRVIARSGAGDSDYFMGAFLWNADESDATFVPEGVANALGTDHDVPSAAACWTCHAGEPGRVLGFSAVQQPNAPAASFEAPPPLRFSPPGNETTRAALGYLHANCGHCHNPNGSARPDTDMDLRLSFADREPEHTGAYRTALGRSLQAFGTEQVTLRIARGRPAESAVLLRMTALDAGVRMPPLGSERVDPAGIAAVRRFIESL
jgi:hypothetical protein